MNHTRGWRAGIAIGAVLCFVAALFVVAPPAAADGHTSPPPVDEVFGDENAVTVWERSFLTLRADASDAGATIPNADWRVRSPNNDETSLNRDPIPIYDVGSTVGFEFDENRADKGGMLGDADVEVVRAHVGDVDDTSASFSDDLDLLTDDANGEATFTSVTSTQLDDGAVTVEDAPPESGEYLYFLFKEDGPGVEVSGGELSVESPATVLGMDRIVVRKGSGDVTAPESVEAGDDAPFEVDATGLDGDTVSQTVVLYDEETYVQQYFVVGITGEIDDDFDFEDDSRLETSIERVNGVTRGDENLGDGSVDRSAGIESVVDFVAEGGASGTTDVVATDDVELDGSVTAIDRSTREASVDVGTLDNWTDGEYRWVYYASGEDSGEVYVQTDTLQVREESDGSTGDGGGNGGGGGDGDGDGSGDGGDDSDSDDEDSEEAVSDCESPNEPALATSGNQVTGSIGCVDPSQPIPLDLGLEATNGSHSVTFDRINVTTGDEARDVYVTVRAHSKGPENVSVEPTRFTAVAYLTVELDNVTDADTSEANFGFQVAESTLDALDTAPEDVVLLRYHEGSWNTVETTHLGGTQFRAEGTGFSTFAVGAPTASLAVTEASLGDTTVGTGEPVEVSATIENTGSRSGSRTVEVTADDAVHTTENVTVGANTTTTETVTFSFDEAGTYDVAVDGVRAGSVTVGDGDDPGTPTPGELGGGATLPLVILVTVVALAGIGAGLYYRRL